MPISLTFKTEKERLAHPQVSLIPELSWKYLFSCQINPEWIDWMKLPWQSVLQNIPPTDAFSRLSDTEKEKAFLVLIFSHPDAPTEWFMECASHLQLQLQYQSLFDLSCELNRLDILQHLEQLVSPEQLQAMISSRDFEAFRSAAEKGLLDVLRYLESKAPDQLQAMISAVDFDAFRSAASNGHLNVLRYLESKVTPSCLQAMISTWDFDAYSWAAEKGRLNVLRYLESKVTPSCLQEMISSGSFQAFYLAAENGHLDVLEHLESQAPGLLQETITKRGFDAFRKAAKNGHLHVLRYLEFKAPGLLQAMISSQYFQAFIWAAENGHLEILNYLESKAPDQLQAMISTCNFQAFRMAAANGHLEILNYLESKAPDRLQSMISAWGFEAFRRAAENGRLDVLRYLEYKAPNQFQAMISSGRFQAFYLAAANGHLEILNYLESKAPDRLQSMISAWGFEAFRRAAENGHLEILNYLESKAPDQVQTMIRAEHFYAFHKAVENKHPLVSHHLLSFRTVFAYAEAHVQEYGNIITPFVEQELQALTERKTTFERDNPNGVFDVPQEEAQDLFYRLRHFIRLSRPEHRDHILFLLQLPAVIAIAASNNNELLRLAMSTHCTYAAQLLLGVPEVRQLAQANDMYQNENIGGIDLQLLSRDGESSMTALTQGEQARLEDAIAAYQPILDTAGVPHVIDTLRQTLQDRYKAHPAKIKKNLSEEIIILPFDWQTFEALPLTAEEKQRALEAYYQHPDHTAYRYLSKPNLWMHPSASYVHVDNNNPNHRYASYENYLPLIAMLYLAAQDTTYPPTDEFTYEGRLEHFIKELSLIGRAHNWDTEQINSSTGKPEEYDDLEGDRPSCLSGTKRRLFQALLGHPLFKTLTIDDVKQEMRAYFKAHIESVLKDPNHAHLIKTLWGKLAEGILSEDEQIQLQAYNLNQAQIDDFFNAMRLKHDKQWHLDSVLTTYVEFQFSLNKDHLVNLGGVIGLSQLLDQLPSPSAPSFFRGTKRTRDQEPLPPAQEQRLKL